MLSKVVKFRVKFKDVVDDFQKEDEQYNFQKEFNDKQEKILQYKKSIFQSVSTLSLTLNFFGTI